MRGSRAITCRATGATNPRTATLRRLLKQPGILQGPCCHDGLSARLIEKAGFQFAFMSGFCTAGARLGAPDTGLITYSEMVDTGRNIHEATRGIPIIGDGDTGYGNALNVKRTVRGYAQAGFAGILIEDQVAPKSCGHVKGKRVTSREEAVSRIRAAVDAREEGADILVLARTDARQAHSLEEALWRVAAFADAGADILFIDALESEEEMRRFCWAGGAAARVPKMANMLEGGGKTPILSPRQLQDLGFKLVAYPLSLLGVSIKAMETALQDLKQGVVPGPDQLPSFADMQAAVGFPEYYVEEARYAISLPSSTPNPTPTPAAGDSGVSSTASASWGSMPQAAKAPAATEAPPRDAAASSTAGASSSSVSSASQQTKVAAEEAPSSAASTAAPSESPSTTSTTTSSSTSSGSSSPGPASGTAGGGASGADGSSTVVEPDVVYEPRGLILSSSSVSDDEAQRQKSESGSPPPPRPRFFRVVITDQATNTVKLETRIPATFLSGLTAIVPAVAGINLESMIDRALRERKQSEPGGALVSLPNGQDLLQVFLEF